MTSAGLKRIRFIAVLAFAFLLASSALAATEIGLTVSVVSPKRWTMRLENTGDLPVRIVADPYLLSFEIMVPAGAIPSKAKRPSPAQTVRCVLPADMRPATDAGRGVVLSPGKAYKESFDPRMYCFGARESAALVRGARVVAHYGFATARAAKRPSKQPLSAPFVVSPIPNAQGGGSSGSPLKEVIAREAIELSDDAVGATTTDSKSSSEVASPTTSPVTTPVTPPIVSEGDGTESTLTVTLPARSDGARAQDLNLSLTLTNVGARRTAVYLRPQSVAFDILAGPGGGAGETSCPARGGTAIRELFTTLGPKARAQVTVIAATSCPDQAFDLPGLYEVRPRLDTRRVVGSPSTLHAFEGEIVGAPALVRIRTGKPGTLRPPPMIE